MVPERVLPSRQQCVCVCVCVCETSNLDLSSSAVAVAAEYTGVCSPADPPAQLNRRGRRAAAKAIKAGGSAGAAAVAAAPEAAAVAHAKVAAAQAHSESLRRRQAELAVQLALARRHLESTHAVNALLDAELHEAANEVIMTAEAVLADN